MRRALRLGLYIVGGIIGLPLCGVLAAYLFLQTDSGKSWLADTLSRQLSAPDSPVTVVGITGAPPFDLRIASIAVGDRDGTWGQIQDVQLAITARALAHGELAISSLRAATIAVSRLPAASAAAAGTRPELRLMPPRLPVDISVERMAIDRVTLGAAVLGEPATLTLAADARLAGGAAALHLDLRRTDATPGAATVDLTLAGAPPRLDLAAEISEPTGLLMARLLQRPDRAPLSLTLKGAGPITAWQGTLAAKAGSLLDLHADIGLAAQAGYQLTLDGEGTQSGLLPPKLQPLIGDDVRFAGQVGYADGDISIDRFTLATAAAQLTAKGMLTEATQAISGETQLILPDLAAATPFAGALLSGRLQADARIGGSVAQPDIRLTLAGTGARVDALAADRVAAELHLAGDSAGRGPWTVSGSGQLAGISREGQPLPARLGDRVDWSIDGTLDPAGPTFAMDHATVTDAVLSLAATGKLAPQASNAAITLEFADLAAFDDLADLPQLRGRLTLAGDIAVDAAANVSTSLHGTTAELRTGIAAADAVLGPRVDLKAVLARATDGGLSLSSLQVAGAAMTLDGNASQVPTPDRLSGRFTMRLPDAAPLGPALRTTLRGAVTVVADIAGTLSHPSLQARLDGRDLGSTDVIARQLTADVRIADLVSPGGTLTATMDTAGPPARLEADFAQTAPDRLRVPRIALTAADTQLTGNLDLDLTNGHAAGRLAGMVPDLRPWSRLAGLPASGRADLALTLDTADGQTADLALNIDGLVLGEGADASRIERLSFAGHGSNLTDKPSGHLAVDAVGAATQDVRLDHASVQANASSMDSIAFTASTSGTLTVAAITADRRDAPISLDAAGDWTPAAGVQHVTLKTLAAALGPDTASLRQPLRLGIGEGDYRFDDLSLDVAGGRLHGSAALRGGRLTTTLAAEGLSLAPFGRLVGQAMTGTFDIAADLDGPLAAPRGRLTLAGRQLQVAGLQPPAPPPLGVDLVIEPADGRLSLRGTVAAGDARLVTVDGRIPFSITTQPFSVALPTDRPIDLSLNGDGRLEQLVEWLPMGANRLAGHYQADVKIGGTLAAPQTTGHVAVAGGSYVNEALAADIGDIATDLRVASESAAGRTRWSVDGTGHLGGLRQGGQPLPADLGNAIDWSLRGLFDPADRSFALDRLAANGAGVDLAASGRLSPAASQGTLKLRVAELGAFGGLLGLPQLRGGLAVDADIATDATLRTTATLHGTTADLRTGIAGADALLGPSVELKVEAARDAAGGVALSTLDLKGTAVTMEGTGTRTAADQLAGSVTLHVPDLTPLGPALDTTLRGRMSLAATIAGSLAHPSLRAQLDGRDLGVGNSRADRIIAEMQVDDVNAPAGTLNATANSAGLEARLETAFDRPAPDRLRLSRLTLSASGTRLAGELAYDLAQGRMTGKLTGGASDLRPWSQLAGLPLAGRADLNVTLGDDRGQTALLTATGSGLSLGEGGRATQIGRLSIKGQGSDLTGKPAGRITIDLADATAGGAQIASAGLQATSRSGAAVAFSGKATGTLTVARGAPSQRVLPLAVDIGGDWKSAPAAQQIGLSRLAMNLGPDSIDLQQPLGVTLAPGNYRVQGIALAVGAGRLSGDAALKGNTLTVKLAATRVPLAPLGRLAGEEVTGEIDATADLDGPATAPRGQVTLKGHGLQFASLAQANLPPLGIELAIVPGDRQLSVQGTVASPDAKLVAIAGTVPFAISASPLSVTLPQDRPLALTVDGDGRLEKLAELLPLGEDRLAGHYRLALAVKGTPAAPQAAGRFTIDQGSYSGQAFGTRIKAIDAELTGDGSKLQLTRFTGTDGQAGRLSASGSIDLAASPSPVFDLKGTLTQFLAASSDDARATVDADIRIDGSVAAPKLFARIRMPHGDFRIPDRLPSSVVTLDVIEIDSRMPDVAAQRLAQARQQRATARTSALPVALDVQIVVPGQTFVRGHGLDSEWRGKITIAGDAAKPDFTGGLEVVRGNLNLLGRNFRIQRGIINFPTGDVTEPRIDLLAEYSASDITAQVHMTGSPTAPHLQLSSTPQLPQDEVLSHVLFGRDNSQITPAEGVELAVAARNLAEGGPGLLDRLRTSLGLDRLDIGSSSSLPANTSIAQPSVAGVSPSQQNTASGSETSTSPTVSGGKYVAPGVFVGVEQGATTQSSRAKVEVEITHHITGYSSVGSTSSQVGVNWRYDY
jgi:translocation and assembly module TamB